jgi:hypothetical protein
MAYQAGGQRSQPRPVPESLEAQAYLQDYATLLEALPFPSVVFDHRWDFVLFHPDAGAVLGEHESSWCLPMLAHFADAVEQHGQDRGLQSIRRDIAQDPIMEAAYRQGLPHWIRAVGPEGVEQDGAVRPLVHPDPRWGRTDCRIIGETPKTLQDMGYTRMTLVLRETRRPPAAPRRTRPARHGAAHLRVV